MPSFIFDPYSDDLDLDQLELIAAKFYAIDDIGSYKEYIEKTFSGIISAEDN